MDRRCSARPERLLCQDNSCSVHQIPLSSVRWCNVMLLAGLHLVTLDALHPSLTSLNLLQENTVVQTCVVACYSLASSGGFGCYLLSMDQQTYANLGNIAGNRPEVPPPLDHAAKQDIWTA